MKRTYTIILIALFALLFTSCGNPIKNTYLSRNVSCYSTPSGDAFGCAVKLNRGNKTYTLYENSFRNQKWQETKKGNYSENVNGNIVEINLNIEPERFGDVYKVEIDIEHDCATLISISSRLRAPYVNTLQ